MIALPLRVMIVDDEALARRRLEDLLSDIAAQLPNCVVGQAANGLEALKLLDQVKADVVLADVSMPAMNGVEFARRASARSSPPAVIFTTAYDDYALEAFDVAATDYLVKPVRAERLASALSRVRQSSQPASVEEVPHFVVTERGRTIFLPVSEVVYLRAELKYVTARTREREYLLGETLVQIEQKYPERFLRLHRNCLVAINSIAGVRRTGVHDGEARWEVLLNGVPDTLIISRRQWPSVRQVLGV